MKRIQPGELPAVPEAMVWERITQAVEECKASS
jgi:hypothetical protein